MAYNFYVWAYSISSAVVTFFTWVVLYWAMDEDNLHRRRIFRYDTNAKVCVCFSIFVYGAVIFIVLAYGFIVNEKHFVVSKNCSLFLGGQEDFLVNLTSEAVW